MTDDALGARDMLDDMARVRAHARSTRAADALAAALAATLSLGGAAVFFASTQITTTACRATPAGRSCGAETVEFNGWAYWVIGGAVAAGVTAVVRHVRGVRRAAAAPVVGRLTVILLVAAVAGLFAGYEYAGLGGGTQPWLFPAVVVGILGVLAARRRDRFATFTCAAASGAIVTAGMRAEVALRPAWWFESNTGFALCAAVAMVVAAGLVVRWYRADAE